MSFTGFTASDFDAYLDNKWSSNVFNLERLQVKQKLEALGRQLLPRLDAHGRVPLACEVSAEHPALWNQRRVERQYLFFVRDAEARRELDTLISRQRSMASLLEDPSPLHSHIILAVAIDKAKVELSMRLHASAVVDGDNLLRKMSDEYHRQELLGALQELSSSFEAGLVGGARRPAAQVDDGFLVSLLEEFRNSNTWLIVHHDIPRDDELLGGSQFIDHAASLLQQLVPVMELVAWTRDNDYLAINRRLREQQQQQKSRGISARDRVRVISGMFSGRTGTVQEVDGKGSIKVLIGKMAVKLSTEHVVRL